MIKPTIGRRVHYFPNREDSGRFVDPMTVFDHTQPLDAGICYVHDDRLINVTVADQSGKMHSRTFVQLVQDPSEIVPGSNYVTWMDYQIKTAVTT